MDKTNNNSNKQVWDCSEINKHNNNQLYLAQINNRIIIQLHYFKLQITLNNKEDYLDRLKQDYLMLNNHYNNSNKADCLINK